MYMYYHFTSKHSSINKSVYCFSEVFGNSVLWSAIFTYSNQLQLYIIIEVFFTNLIFTCNSVGQCFYRQLLICKSWRWIPKSSMGDLFAFIIFLNVNLVNYHTILKWWLNENYEVLSIFIRLSVLRTWGNKPSHKTTLVHLRSHNFFLTNITLVTLFQRV